MPPKCRCGAGPTGEGTNADRGPNTVEAAVKDDRRPAQRILNGCVVTPLDVRRWSWPAAQLNDALDALAEDAQATAEVVNDSDDASNAREKAISFAHVARTPEDRDENVRELRASDQGENSGPYGTAFKPSRMPGIRL
jgi:hypothetical protein